MSKEVMTNFDYAVNLKDYIEKVEAEDAENFSIVKKDFDDMLSALYKRNAENNNIEFKGILDCFAMDSEAEKGEEFIIPKERFLYLLTSAKNALMIA